jgi:hypothetical protein
MDQIVNERWLPVVGFEGLYEVSDHGRVRSLDRVVPNGARGVRTCRGKVRTPVVGMAGYAEMSLRKNNKTHLQRVHGMVMRAFVGPPPEAHEVRHADHDRLNNLLTNLSYGTRQDNMIDCSKATRVSGQVLTAEDALAICADRRPRAQIAKAYGVSIACVKGVRAKNSFAWAHL